MKGVSFSELRIEFPAVEVLDINLLSMLFASPSDMIERQDILIEYFSLVKDLNQANKFKNEKTQIVFEIEYLENERGVLFAKITDAQKMRLCIESRLNNWVLSPYTKYTVFSEWLVDILIEYFSENYELKLKMTFDDYFHQKLETLLSFKD